MTMLIKINDWKKQTAALFVGTLSTLVLTLTPTAALAQENSLVLCETDPTTVRIYEKNNGLLMRAYDRKRNVVWLNRTPTSVRGTNTGLEYTNELGELTVRVSVDFDDESCAIQVDDGPVEPGTMLRNDTVHSVIGTVTYRQRIALPNGSNISTQLVNLETAELEVVASHRMVTSGEQIPIPFHIFYFPEEINPARRYGIESQIVFTDGQHWATSMDYPVLTQNTPFAIEVVVTPGAEDSAGQPSPIEDKEALPEAIATAVQTAFNAEFGDTPFEIDQYSRETWSDGCLGLGGPAESCLAALTDGWQVELVDLTTEQRYVYRTNLSGDSVRREK